MERAEPFGTLKLNRFSRGTIKCVCFHSVSLYVSTSWFGLVLCFFVFFHFIFLINLFSFYTVWCQRFFFLARCRFVLSIFPPLSFLVLVPSHLPVPSVECFSVCFLINSILSTFTPVEILAALLGARFRSAETSLLADDGAEDDSLEIPPGVNMGRRRSRAVLYQLSGHYKPEKMKTKIKLNSVSR